VVSFCGKYHKQNARTVLDAVQVVEIGMTALIMLELMNVKLVIAVLVDELPQCNQGSVAGSTVAVDGNRSPANVTVKDPASVAPDTGT